MLWTLTWSACGTKYDSCQRAKCYLLQLREICSWRDNVAETGVCEGRELEREQECVRKRMESDRHSRANSRACMRAPHGPHQVLIESSETVLKTNLLRLYSQLHLIKSDVKGIL